MSPKNNFIANFGIFGKIRGRFKTLAATLVSYLLLTAFGSTPL
jgi:hypothetical protein